MRLEPDTERNYDAPQVYANLLRDTITTQLDEEYDAEAEQLIAVSDAEWRDIGHTAQDFFSHYTPPQELGYINRDTEKWLERAANQLDDASVYDPVTADDVMNALQGERQRAVHGEDSVVCIYMTEDDDLLLIQRGKLDHAGEWMPPAGRVEHGETPEETATRETMEEAGVITEFEKVGEAYDSDYGATLHIMMATADDHEAAEAGSDATNVDWVPYDAMGDKEMPPTMRVIATAAPHLAEYTDATPEPVDDPMTILDWPSSGHYTIEQPDDGDVPDTATIFTDNSMFRAGLRDDGEPYVWVEALGTLPPHEEKTLRNIGEALTGKSAWEKTFDGIVQG